MRDIIKCRCGWRVLFVPLLGVAIASLNGLVCGSGTSADGWNYVAALPAFKIKDPNGREYTDKDFRQGPVVVILTIPNVKHGDLQRSWSKYLTKKEWPAEKAKLILIEDISQTGDIRERALKGIKESFNPDKLPLLLLDMDGDVRRSFRVQNDETALLVFDKDGKNVYSFDEKPSIDEARAVLKLVEKF